MAKVNLVEKTVVLNNNGIIRFQLLSYCYINKIEVTQSDLDCLTLLGENGEVHLSKFCKVVIDKEIFKTSQTVRNCITKAVNNKLISKIGKSKIKIALEPQMNIQTTGNILLNYKIGCFETSTS